jgi:hypothetical protein
LRLDDETLAAAANGKAMAGALGPTARFWPAGRSGFLIAAQPTLE